MTGGRSGANNEGGSDEWGEDDDETTPAPTESPLKKKRGEFNILLHEVHSNNMHTFKEQTFIKNKTV
jgi:hypothetical protein